jgi:outer membrane protein OmpA-like peptidoglycan-associated protein
MFARVSLKAVVLSALLVPLMSACATRRFVRESIATERVSVDSSIAGVNNGLATERAAREAADNQLRGTVDQLRTAQNQMRTDIDALRRDLTTMRNEFNVEISQLKEGLKFNMPVGFDFNSDSVREQDKAVLDRFASVINTYYAGAKLTVEGFADPSGGSDYNQKLSQRRADNVRDYLVGKGIPNHVLQSIGYGETRQVVKDAARDQPGAELNRRVVFVIESRPGAITMMN